MIGVRMMIGRAAGPLRRSLTVKWLLSLLMTGLFGIMLVAMIANRATSSGFDQLKLEQVQQSFIAVAQTYYAGKGSWAGFLESIGPAQQALTPGTGGDIPPQFLLVDADNVVVAPMPPFHEGQRLSPAQVEGSSPIIVNGQRVGAVIVGRDAPALNPFEQRFLEGINQALLIGAISSAALALLVGFVLTRLFLRPLRDLTQALRAMHGGQLDQAVPVRGQDELGDLTRAFNEMSRELSRAQYLRRQMTADIAHDLRTPLTVISGYLEALYDGTLRPTPERFATMHEEVTHLQRLVEDLRTVSLADAGELRLNLQAFPVQPLIEQVAAAFSPIAAASGIQVEAIAAVDLPTLRADRERVVQALGNLISNALRHTPAGGRITLRVDCAPDGVRLSVQDTGEGIPPDKLPFIFERLFRVDEARSSTAEASGVGETGLGLAIVRSIAEAHGGQVSAQSVVGLGTTLTMTLPAAPASARSLAIGAAL